MTSQRFTKNAYTSMQLAHSKEPLEENQLYVPDPRWTPNPNELSNEYKHRVTSFLAACQKTIKKRRGTNNLTPLQTALLRKLQHSNELIVFPADKNLGPCITERTTYIKKALELLTNTEHYQQLTAEQANTRIQQTKYAYKSFILQFKKQLGHHNVNYLERMLANNKDPFSYFYITGKIHKGPPWKPRPIVSYCGSLLHGLAKWADQSLKPICTQLPTYLSSSFDLKTKLEQLARTLPFYRMKLFTADANSMYTNICTDHALETIRDFLHKPWNQYVPSSTPVEAIMAALEIVMRNNFFKFGNTIWLQTSGTAMGTPPAVWWATLYFAINELKFLSRYRYALPFYGRYIDDAIGVWITLQDEQEDKDLWTSFQDQFNYGKLTWKFSERRSSTDMLDTTITIEVQHKRLSFKLYEKHMNLYQYLPSHSAHPPGVLQGLIYGNIFRITRLCTYAKDRDKSIQDFYLRLQNRGYSRRTLKPLFAKALYNAINKSDRKNDKADMNRFFLHVNYHPNDPPSRTFQHLFRTKLLQPRCSHTGRLETKLPDMTNLYGAYLDISRMTVCYHKPKNVKNLLFPRKLPQNATSRDEPADVASLINQE